MMGRMRDSVIIFGAGKIGRSFLGLIFSRAGLQVTFIDAVPQVVDELQKAGGYSVIQLSPDGSRRTDHVEGIAAIRADDSTAVRTAVTDASIICTAVGMRAFASVMEQIAAALAGAGARGPVRVRQAMGGARNIILAENIHGAGRMARDILERHDVSVVPAPGGVGIIETSIGKMVPTSSPPGLELSSPMDVTAEAYSTLIVDRRKWAGAFPDIDGLKGVQNIQAYVDRKLFIHNFGHAAAAYLGALERPEGRYIAEVLESPTVLEGVRAVMVASADALAAEYPGDLTPADLMAHVTDLIARFRNPYLYDTVIRVGRDLRRKLGPADRIVGAMRLMAEHSLDLQLPARVYHAALVFAPADLPPEDLLPEDRQLQAELAEHGLSYVLERYSGLGPEVTGAEAAVREAVLGSCAPQT